MRHTRTIFDERLERLVRLHRVGLDRLQIRLEDDQLEVPPEVLQAAVRVLTPLRLIGCLLRTIPGLLDGVAYIQDLGALVDGIVHSLLHLVAFADDTEEVYYLVSL